MLNNLPQAPNGAGVEPTGWQWIGSGNIGGRVRAILTDPADPNLLFAGGVGGGVWKTTDGGANWQPVGENMSNLAVSSLAMDATNHNVIYAGTGEGFYNGDAIRGAGIYKTSDGGVNWAPLAATSPVTTTNFLYVNRLAAHPSSPGTLLAATLTGLFRTSDGGESWTQVINGEVLEVQFNPSDGSKATASGNNKQAWYSTDYGFTWNASDLHRRDQRFFILPVSH